LAGSSPAQPRSAAHFDFPRRGRPTRCSVAEVSWHPRNECRHTRFWAPRRKVLTGSGKRRREKGWPGRSESSPRILSYLSCCRSFHLRTVRRRLRTVNGCTQLLQFYHRYHYSAYMAQWQVYPVCLIYTIHTSNSTASDSYRKARTSSPTGRIKTRTHAISTQWQRRFSRAGNLMLVY
jgi:hypothetical protein